MKKIILITLAAFALIGCQKELPTISPAEATIYTGDVLQLEITGADNYNPIWRMGTNDPQAVKDSVEFVKMLSGNRALALVPGDISLGFEYFAGQSFGQQVYFVFMKLHILRLPAIKPAVYTMAVGDTLALELLGIENPTWEIEYPGAKPENDIFILTDDNKVIALATGEVRLGFTYDSQSDLGPAKREAFTTITIVDEIIEEEDKEGEDKEEGEEGTTDNEETDIK